MSAVHRQQQADEHAGKVRRGTTARGYSPTRPVYVRFGHRCRTACVCMSKGQTMLAREDTPRLQTCASKLSAFGSSCTYPDKKAQQWGKRVPEGMW